MPFRSKAQMRWMFAAEERGELPEGTARRWAHETPNIKSLPDHAGSKKSKDKKKSVKRAALSLLLKIAVRKLSAELVKNAAKAPVAGPQPGVGNLPVEWPLTVTAPAAKGGKFILSADFFGPNLLDKRLGKGPGTMTVTSNGTVRPHHVMKFAKYLVDMCMQQLYD